MHKKVSGIILKERVVERVNKGCFIGFDCTFIFFNIFEISKDYETLRMINFGWKESRKLRTGISSFSPKTIFTEG
jgi:hypothetical protein